MIGSISAIYQKRIKRLFAYSTIAHTGFILLAFLCCSLDASKALIFYILIYSCLTITTFAILINIAASTSVQPKYLINLAAIGSKNYIFSVALGLNILATAGIPPLAGFFSKFFILLSVIGAEYYFTAAAAIDLALTFAETISDGDDTPKPLISDNIFLNALSPFVQLVVWVKTF